VPQPIAPPRTPHSICIVPFFSTYFQTPQLKLSYNFNHDCRLDVKQCLWLEEYQTWSYMEKDTEQTDISEVMELFDTLYIYLFF